MTNAIREADADTRPLEYIGLDMAKARFEWGVHGARSTRGATNDAAGDEALLADLRERRVGLIVIEATGGLEHRLAGVLLQAGLPVVFRRLSAACLFSLAAMAADGAYARPAASTPAAPTCLRFAIASSRACVCCSSASTPVSARR